MALDPTYFVGVKESACAANKRHICIWNGSGSGVTLRILQVQAAGAPITTGAGLVVPLYAAFITTAPTGGTTIVPSVADGGASPPAQLIIVSGATGGASEEASPFGVGVVSSEETSSGNEAQLYQYILNGGRQVKLPIGRGIVIKQGALANSVGAVSVVVTVSGRAGVN